MQAVLHSAFLQALGYAIANSLWQAGLLWLLYQLVSNMGRLSASRKYVAAVVAQFAAFAWFLFTLRFYYGYCSDILANAGEVIGTGTARFIAPEVTGLSSALLYGMIRAEQLLPYLSAAYLCMLLLLLVRLGRAWHYTRIIRVQGLHKADVDLRLFVQRTAGYLGIKHPVRIYLSSLVNSPLTIGFWKPLILLPVASVTHLTPTQLEAVLLHELAHIKRADFVLNILQSVIETMLFFNPFIRMLGKQLRRERENSCDDWVLQFQYRADVYAEALLRIATLQAQPAFTLQATGGKGELLPRVQRMLQKQDAPGRYRNQVVAFLLLTIMLATVAWINPGMQQARSTRSANTAAARTINIEPLAANISNPAFNPLYFIAKTLSEELDKPATTQEHAPQDGLQPPVGVAQAPLPDAPASITPLAMEQIGRMMEEIGAAFDEQAALADIRHAGWEQMAAGFEHELADSLKRVQAELNNIDWEQVGKELRNASASLQEELNRNNLLQLFPGVQQVQQMLQQPAAIARQREAERRIELLQADVERKARKTDSVMRAVQKNREQVNQALRRKMARPGIPAYVAVTDSVITHPLLLSGLQKYGVDLEPLIMPALYTGDDYTYRFADAEHGIDEALIVITHDPGNEQSHIKNITITITGNNGKTKTYHFSVALYQ